MITKTKGPKLPAAKHATPRTKAAAKKLAGSRSTLTDQVKAEAIEIVRDQFPTLAIDCRMLNVEQAELVIRKTLFENRVGPPFEFHEDGEPWLIATADGLSVTYQGRDGMLTWLDVACDFAGNAFDGDVDPGTEPDLDEVRAQLNAALAGDESAATPIEYRNAVVSIRDIEAGRGNPRKVFDEAKLAELAESIKAVGLLEPLVVSEAAFDGIHELLAGERRLRAAKLAGLTHVPVRIAVGITPAQADEIRVIENLQRQDLSAIEEARGFERMLKAHGYTQEKLAERLGVSQPHIANRLRLLKLPEKWQQRVISQEIPPTHARSILPWVEYPAIMQKIEADLYDKKGQLRDDDMSVGEMDRRVDWAVRSACKRMGKDEYEPRLGKYVPLFKPSPEEQEQLGIVNLGGVEYATNVKLWNKLRNAQLKPLLPKKAAEKRTDRAAREDRKPRRDSDETIAKHVAAWRVHWLQYLLAKLVPEDDVLAHRALLVNLLGYDPINNDEIAELVGYRPQKKYGDKYEAELRAIVLACTDFDALLRRMAARTLWEPGPKGGRPVHTHENEDAIEDLARSCRLDLADAWNKELAGPLTEAFFNLHDSERLEKLGAELDVYIKPRTSKAAAVKQLMGHRNTRLKLPSAIQPVAPLAAAKKAAKPKAKKGKA